MHWAAYYGQVESIKTLHNLGGKIDTPNNVYFIYLFIYLISFIFIYIYIYISYYYYIIHLYLLYIWMRDEEEERGEGEERFWYFMDRLMVLISCIVYVIY
jgi:hypothetical protein